ncbi:PAR14-like protein [Mya arenaria]|uniref:Poly [ADP-ribose] polymerase n=1 Tax=Mya arenaria TaxID=6604 RepID=A0ABY7FIP4_MYAAR|nr:PAR14-like protein [Mya arenaria]
MESTIKDDSSKEGHNAGSTADEHANVHLYPRLDGTGPLGPPDMTGLNGRMPMQSHVPPPGGPRFMYPPVPQNVWYPQMQPHNMYANYPENTPYLGPPRPPGPVGQFPMQYFNPMPYPLNYPTSNAPLAVPSEFKPHTKPKPDDKNAHADKKQTRLNKKAVINEPFEEEKADGSDPSAQLLLRCVPKEVSRDVLELFLENKNRSGGGSVKELTLNKRSGVAYVTFEDFRDAENVLRKAKQSGTLYLPTSKCDLEVIRFEETQHAHYFNEIPHTSVFVKNIAVDSSDETLKNYFEVRCKAKPTDVIRSLSRKTALFEFEDTIDISSMTRAFGHNRLEGNILDMIEVQETRQVKVTGVKAGTSPQVLELYFDNHARSKGGEVQTIEKVDKDNSFIVTFVHPEDARQVVHAQHILDGLKLSANLYNALLDTDPDSVVTIPEVVDVSGIDQNIVRFLQNSKEYRNKVENCVKDAFGQLIWTNDDGGIRLQVSCDVKPNDSDALRKITFWKENHTKCFDWVRKEVIAIEINDAFKEGTHEDVQKALVKVSEAKHRIRKNNIQGLSEQCLELLGSVEMQEIIRQRLSQKDILAVDVIVNATNQKLDMSVGVVSQQLLKVAGAELQTECTPFPALGTGRCEYPSDVVADTLIKSVMEYENDHPDTNIRCVSFVIWSKDVETIKAFTKTKEEMSKRQKQKDRRRTEPDSRRKTQTTALTVYTNKPQNIRRIESRIKEFRKEDEIFPPASLLEQLTDDRIERIQNPALYGQYFAKKKHMESAGGVSNEKMLWHGTRTPEVAAIINKKGFDRNYNSGALIGAGVYFAVNANMSASGYCSPDKMGQKYIFHASVLTGDSGRGSGGIRVPPPKVPGNPLITFDSTCDNVANPSMFAVFHDAQAYPSFMITFK